MISCTERKVAKKLSGLPDSLGQEFPRYRAKDTPHFLKTCYDAHVSSGWHWVSTKKINLWKFGYVPDIIWRQLEGNGVSNSKWMDEYKYSPRSMFQWQECLLANLNRQWNCLITSSPFYRLSSCISPVYYIFPTNLHSKEFFWAWGIQYHALIHF